MRFLFVFSFFYFTSFSQDSIFTRYVIKELCSKKMLGRGYVKNGMKHAADFIEQEIKNTKATPLFENKYRQEFVHPVNSFPNNIQFTLNGKKYIPGKDFITDPESPAIKGKFIVKKKDSITYLAENTHQRFIIKSAKKLTYSVGMKQNNAPVIQVLSSVFPENVSEATLKVKPVFIPEFKASNLAASISGSLNDTMIVFTAHYDHLGAMGKNTWFPGANDNASGVSMLLNLMRYYSENKPYYKTVFVFFAGEEAGLLGSKYFTEQNSLDLTQIKFLINLDLLGTGEDGIMAVNGAVYTKEFELLQQLNNRNQGLKEIRKRGKAMNSDHYWFTEKGVPSFFIYTLGGVAHYHDIYDRPETLPLTKYKEVYKLIIDFTKALSPL
jgi:aminopeptidase YwaD